MPAAPAGEPRADDRPAQEPAGERLTSDPGPAPASELLDTPAPALPEEIAAPPEELLLVMVTTAPAPSPVAVTRMPESAPGYARAVALRPEPDGSATWTQATATTGASGSRLDLVMLGSDAWLR